MAMVNVVTIAAYRRIYWLRLIGLAQRWRHLALRATFVKWTGWTLAVAVHCYDDSTINIVLTITIAITDHNSDAVSHTHTVDKNEFKHQSINQRKLYSVPPITWTAPL